MSKVRVWFLWLKQIVRNALAKCDICGSTGVNSWSLHPAGLCNRCDAAYQEALKLYGSTREVEAYILAAGKKSFLIGFGGVNLNPLAESQENLQEYEDLRNQTCVVVEDEIPCFDTFPAPPPAQICTRALPHMCGINSPCNGYPNVAPPMFGGHPAQNCTKFESSKAMGISGAGLYDSQGRYNY